MVPLPLGENKKKWQSHKRARPFTRKSRENWKRSGHVKGQFESEIDRTESHKLVFTKHSPTHKISLGGKLWSIFLVYSPSDGLRVCSKQEFVFSMVSPFWGVLLAMLKNFILPIRKWAGRRTAWSGPNPTLLRVFIPVLIQIQVFCKHLFEV